MRSKLLHDAQGQRTFAFVFDSGDEVGAVLEDVAKRQSLNASHFGAVGAFQSVVLGYYDLEDKTYRRKTALNERVTPGGAYA